MYYDARIFVKNYIYIFAFVILNNTMFITITVQ